MPKNSPGLLFSRALETFENLLHAETESDSGQRLETIGGDHQKGRTGLRALLEAKERVGMDARSISEADALVDQVLDLQEKSVESFRRLFQKQFKLSQGKVDSENPIDRKLRKAYFAFGVDRLPDTEG